MKTNSNPFWFLQQLEKIILSYKNIFLISSSLSKISGWLYKVVTSLTVISKTGESIIKGIALSLWEQSCKTALALTLKGKIFFSNFNPFSLGEAFSFSSPNFSQNESKPPSNIGLWLSGERDKFLSNIKPLIIIYFLLSFNESSFDVFKSAYVFLNIDKICSVLLLCFL